MNHTKSVLLAALALAATAMVTGCEEEEDAGGGGSGPKVKAEAPVAEPVPEKKVVDTSYSYEVMVGGEPRRDPFQSYVSAVIMDEPIVEGATPLQRIDLDKLKLIAVVVGTSTPMAMVEDAEGRGYTVKIGTLVGKRLGQVKHIRRGEVVVQEEFRDFTGKRVPQLKNLKLDEQASRAP